MTSRVKNFKCNETNGIHRNFSLKLPSPFHPLNTYLISSLYDMEMVQTESTESTESKCSDRRKSRNVLTGERVSPMAQSVEMTLLVFHYSLIVLKFGWIIKCWIIKEVQRKEACFIVLRYGLEYNGLNR